MSAPWGGVAVRAKPHFSRAYSYRRRRCGGHASCGCAQVGHAQPSARVCARREIISREQAFAPRAKQKAGCVRSNDPPSSRLLGTGRGSGGASGMARLDVPSDGRGTQSWRGLALAPRRADRCAPAHSDWRYSVDQLTRSGLQQGCPQRRRAERRQNASATLTRPTATPSGITARCTHAQGGRLRSRRSEHRHADVSPGPRQIVSAVRRD